MESPNEACTGLDTVVKDVKIDTIPLKDEEKIAPTELGAFSPEPDIVPKIYVEDSDKFCNSHAGGDSKSEHSDNTDSATESNDSPVDPILDETPSTLILVTDLTQAATPDDTSDIVSEKSSYDLLRLATSLTEPSQTSIKGGDSDAKKILSPTAKKRSLLNELEVATNAELQEELALIRANHLPRRNWIDDLVHWRDPVHSASVFGTSFTLLLATTVYSLVSVVGYAGLVLLLCGTLLRIFSSASQRSANLQRRSLMELSAAFREENIRRVIDVAANHVHPWVLRLRRLLLVESVPDSLQFAGALYSLTYVGALFDGLWLMLLVLLSAFTLPPLYERHKEVVDARLVSFQAAWDRVVQEARNTAKSPLGKRD